MAALLLVMDFQGHYHLSAIGSKALRSTANRIRFSRARDGIDDLPNRLRDVAFLRLSFDPGRLASSQERHEDEESGAHNRTCKQLPQSDLEDDLEYGWPTRLCSRWRRRRGSDGGSHCGSTLFGGITVEGKTVSTNSSIPRCGKRVRRISSGRPNATTASRASSRVRNISWG